MPLALEVRRRAESSAAPEDATDVRAHDALPLPVLTTARRHLTDISVVGEDPLHLIDPRRCVEGRPMTLTRDPERIVGVHGCSPVGRVLTGGQTLVCARMSAASLRTAAGTVGVDLGCRARQMTSRSGCVDEGTKRSRWLRRLRTESAEALSARRRLTTGARY